MFCDWVLGKIWWATSSRVRVTPMCLLVFHVLKITVWIQIEKTLANEFIYFSVRIIPEPHCVNTV